MSEALSRFPRIVAWLMLAVLIAAGVAGVIAWRSTIGSDSGGPLPVQVTRPMGKCTIAFRVKSGDWADAPSDVYVIEPDGRGQRNATRTPKLYEWDPVWSPDGRKLAFSATRTYGPATQVYPLRRPRAGLLLARGPAVGMRRVVVLAWVHAVEHGRRRLPEPFLAPGAGV
jgi:hypothetical protein